MKLRIFIFLFFLIIFLNKFTTHFCRKISSNSFYSVPYVVPSLFLISREKQNDSKNVISSRPVFRRDKQSALAFVLDYKRDLRTAENQKLQRRNFIYPLFVAAPSFSKASDISQKSASACSSSAQQQPISSVESNSYSQNSLYTDMQEIKRRRLNVSEKVAQMLYEDMLLGRMAEDMCAQQYYRGKIAGFVHLYTGQEAISTGIIKALRQDDFVISTYRDHVHAISKGVPVREVFAELYGKETGCSKGRGGSMHMFSKKYGMVGGFAYIGEHIPIALGLAFSISYKKNTPQINDQKADQVAVCFLGDGATNMGQFYESLNMAQIAKLPIIFVVENNNWAIGMAAHRSTSTTAIYRKAEGFGIRGIEVDGMDVLSVRTAAREAIDRARKGFGPTVIEALTYRFRGHSLADPDEMRAAEERRIWASRDPVTMFKNYMLSMNYANEATLDLTQEKIRNVLNDAIKFAEESPDPKMEDLKKYVFTDSQQTDKRVNDVLTSHELNLYAQALKEEFDLKDKKKMGDKKSTSIKLLTDPLHIID